MRKKLLLALLLIAGSVTFSNAQIDYGWSTLDSSKIEFHPDSAISLHNGSLIIDTSGISVWQLGTTTKSFFDTAAGIMTDTSQFYPVNSNDGFVVKMRRKDHTIFSFVHKYQTTAGKDGGIVEVSVDSGLTWNNIIGSCYDHVIGGFKYENMYSNLDTIIGHIPAFTGTSSGWDTTYIQVWNALPVRVTGSCPTLPDTIYFRFRFISDSVADNLDGWLLGGFRAENHIYPGAVNEIKQDVLAVAPNPSASGVFTFPALEQKNKYRITITDVQGRTIKDQPYSTTFDISDYPAGLYFYKVSNGVIQYNGKLVR